MPSFDFSCGIFYFHTLAYEFPTPWGHRRKTLLLIINALGYKDSLNTLEPYTSGKWET